MIALLLALALLSSLSNAYTVAHPPPQVVAPSSSLPQALTTTPSNLPSQMELSSLVAKSSALISSEASTSKNVPAGVAITNINYDGNVPKTEADEYVVISNLSKDAPVDISGYSLSVATNGESNKQGSPTFVFPKSSLIKAGASVRVYTNEIHKETGGYSFGSGKAIWNNNGGLAVLRESNGKKVGEFKYSKG